MAIVAMLTWGVYAAAWTFPNDKGSIIQTIFNNEFQTISYRGPNGNGTTIPPGSQAQFIMIFTANPNAGGGSYTVANGLGIAVGPFYWSSPNSLTSFEKNYAIFTFSFLSRFGSGNATLWYSGPQGNLTASYYTSRYGGADMFSSKFDTNILEIPAPGNYTLHYVNNNSPGNATRNVAGEVVMGPSSITYTLPFFYPGLATIAVALGLPITIGVSRRKRDLTSGATLNTTASIQRLFRTSLYCWTIVSGL